MATRFRSPLRRLQDGRPRPLGLVTGGAAVLGLLLLPALAAAQQQPDPARGTLINGYVVEQSTRQPLPSASIELPGLGLQVVSNTEGRFILADVPRGTHAVRVRLLGFADWEGEWEVRGESVAMTIVMGARPVALEGVTAHGYRFGWNLERRRRAVGTSSRVIDRQQLSLSGARDARQLISEIAFLMPISCSDLGFSDCVWVRGRAVQPRVVIDERPSIGGLGELEFYRPDELYAVEIYSGGSHIRAYTTSWVEFQGGRGQRALMPVW